MVGALQGGEVGRPPEDASAADIEAFVEETLATQARAR